MRLVNSPCPICGLPVTDEDDRTWIVPFAEGPDDPLWKLSDATVHTACIPHYPDAGFIQARLDRRQRTAYPMRCDLCGQEIRRAKDLVSIPYLRHVSDELRSELSEKAFHRRCFRSRPDRERLLMALRESPGVTISKTVQYVIWELEQTEEASADR